MVTVRIKLLWAAIFFIPEIGFIGVVHDKIHEDIINWIDVVVMITLLVIPWWVMISWIVNHRVIFDDNGMTVKNRIGFLFIPFYKRAYRVSWDEIRSIWYEPISTQTPLSTAFILDYFLDGKPKKTHIHFMQTNYKKSLRLIVQKIPQGRFKYQAQRQLKKMRIGEWADDIPTKF